jgi:hypothetical protein
VEWNLTQHAWLRAGALFGADTAFLPESEGFVEASIAHGRARGTLEIHRADFDGADLWLGGPGLAIAFPGGVEASAQYYRGRATSIGFDTLTTDTLALGVEGPFGERVRLGAGFTHGIDRLDWLTLDRIAFEADTLSLKASYNFTPFTTFEAGYAFQSRPGDLQVHRARGRLVFRF